MSNYIKNYRAAQVEVIFEGLGGTGKAYILYLLVYFKAVLGWMWNHLRFSVTDIDPTDTQALGDCFYDMGSKVPPTHDLIVELETHPENFPGVKEVGSFNKLRRAAGPGHRFIYGAQVFQPLGLLIWLVQLWKFWPEYLKHLSRPLLELRDYRRHLHNGLFGDNGAEENTQDKNSHDHRAIDRPLLIVQIAGTGGGFGSSQILHHAEARHQINKEVWGAKEYEIRVNLVAPEAFNHHDDRLKANSWRMMLKIEERYLNLDLPPKDYGSIIIERVRPPWVEVALYNRMNFGEHVFRDRDEILQMVAEVDRMKHCSAIADQWHSEFVNHVAFPPEQFCSAAGALRLTIESEGMKNEGTIWLCHGLLSDHLLRRQPEALAEKLAAKDAEVFINQHGLRTQLRSFERDVQGRPIKPVYHSFVGVRRQDLPEQIAGQHHQLSTAVSQALPEVSKKQAGEFRRSVRTEIATQVNTHGLYQAVRSLGKVNHYLAEEQQRVQRQLDKVRSERAAWEQAQVRNQSWGKRLWRDHRKEYTQQGHEKDQLMLQEKKLIAYQGLLQNEMAEGETRRKQLLSWIETLKQVLGELATRAGQQKLERAAQRPVCVVNLLDYLDKEAETRLIKEQMQAHWLPATEGLQFAWNGDDLTLLAAVTEDAIPDPQSLRTQAGLKKLLGYTRSFFDFSQVTVESWLRTSGTSLDGWLSDFERFAAPLVTLNEAKHPRPKIIKIIGSEKGKVGYFAQAVNQGWSVVETADPHNVLVLITWHHLNWRLLSQADSWRRAAERADQPQSSQTPTAAKQATNNSGMSTDTKSSEEVGDAAR